MNELHSKDTTYHELAKEAYSIKSSTETLRLKY